MLSMQTDGSGANCHMSSVAICALLTRAQYASVFQVSCRDRNRIAIQGDVLGAAAMGVANILCLTGDDVTVGDQPQAKRVFDLDSIQLLKTIRMMRDKGVFLSGRKLNKRPRLFLGAASNPFVPPLDLRPHRLAKKIEAGADFIQTQYCFDVPRFRTFMKQVRALGLDKKVFILVGVGPLRSDKAAEFMQKNVPGVHIPDAIVERLRKTPREKKQPKVNSSAKKLFPRFGISKVFQECMSWHIDRKNWSQISFWKVVCYRVHFEKAGHPLLI